MDSEDAFKQIALHRAIRYYSGAKSLAQGIGASRMQVNNWLNRGDNIPYHYAVVIAAKTGISIEHLAPYAKEANKILQPLLASLTLETIVN